MKRARTADFNFDPLVSKFERKVYGGLKGKLRLAVLQNDFSEYVPAALLDPGAAAFSIMDAGSGYGPFSIELAEKGNHLVLCDISGKMLDRAARELETRALQDRVRLINCSIQDLGPDHAGRYDLVLCHAVLEWTKKPEEILRHLKTLLKPEGILSVIFYNLNGTIFKNLLRTNYQKVVNQDYAGWPGSLTPFHPLNPGLVKAWIEALGFMVLCHSGIRVFHDYILDPDDQARSPETVMDLELEFSRQMPFRDLGRYQHILARLEKKMD